MNADSKSITLLRKELGISSRTLRYYEEKGLIHSVREADSRKRRYKEEEIKKIKHIQVLRSLGFSLNRIYNLLLLNSDLAVTIEQQKEESDLELKDLELRIMQLEQALTLLREEEQLTQDNNSMIREYQESIAIAASECIMGHRMSELYQYLSSSTKKLFERNVNLDFLISLLEKKYGAYEKIQSVEILNHMATVWLSMEKNKDNVSIGFGFHGTYIIAIRI